ncbi:MAG: hypothetical protein ACK4MV_09755 [Beijerinckiaceae bacterium]
MLQTSWGHLLFKIVIGKFEFAIGFSYLVIPTAVGLKVPLIGRLYLDRAEFDVDGWKVAKRESLIV